MRKFLPAVALSAFVLSGCYERPRVDDSGGEKTKSATPAAKKSPSAPKPVERSSMEGTWVVQMSYAIGPRAPIGWLPLCLLKISRKSGKLVPEVVRPPEHLKGLRVKDYDISENAAHLVLVHQNRLVDMRFNLRKTEALGDMLRAPSELAFATPARLLATTESRLEAFPPAPHEHYEELNRAMDGLMKQQGTEPLEAFIKKYSNNPLTCYAVYRLNPVVAIRSADDPRPDPREIRDYIKHLESLKAVWGGRLVLLAKLDFAQSLLHWSPQGINLIRKDCNLDVASEIVRGSDTPETRKLLNDAQRRRLDSLKQALRQERNIVAILNTKDAKRRFEAMAQIGGELEAASHYHPWALYVLAEGNRQAGRIDKAVELYADLLVMPAAAFDLKTEFEARWQKPPDLRKRLEELWKRKSGGTDGLDGYLSQAYGKRMHDLLPHLVATKPPRYRKRTHLVETFVNCDDPASIGADVATQLIRRTHTPADVVVLHYHLDDPEANPLVCNDSILRAFDCKVARPPMVFVDGKPLTVSVNGRKLVPDMRSTMGGVQQVTLLVRRALHRGSTDESAKYQVRVSASARSGKLAVKAEVDGPMKADPDLRLRIVLAEDRIAYTGKNGIRYHDMVVRSMPGGIDGVPLSGGKTTFAKTIDLADLSTRLRDFLTSLEEKSSGKVKLSVKPVTFKKLHVVAFVQSTKREAGVLQVAQAVVGGLDSGKGPVPKKSAAKP